MPAHDECYYADPHVCCGDTWDCQTCGETYCTGTHHHTTAKGYNVECVACERMRLGAAPTEETLAEPFVQEDEAEVTDEDDQDQDAEAEVTDEDDQDQDAEAEPTLTINVVVAATGGDGPGFYAIKITCTQDQYDNGDHYDAAEGEAGGAGYDNPMVSFDENDGPEFLFAQFDWAAALGVDISEN